MTQLPAKKAWKSSRELASPFHPLHRAFERLQILEFAWKKLVGNKARFWVLHAVQKNTVFVKVNISVARNELVGRRRFLVSELNKYFEKPWIKHIEII